MGCDGKVPDSITRLPDTATLSTPCTPTAQVRTGPHRVAPGGTGQDSPSTYICCCGLRLRYRVDEVDLERQRDEERSRNRRSRGRQSRWAMGVSSPVSVGHCVSGSYCFAVLRRGGMLHRPLPRAVGHLRGPQMDHVFASHRLSSGPRGSLAGKVCSQGY